VPAGQVLGLVGILLLYLFIAVLRAAYATLSPVALRRILEHGNGSRPANPLGIRMAFDAMHHLTLLAGTILLLAVQASSGARHPYLLSGAILVVSALAAQGLGRVIALANPERAFSVTWSLAALLYRPLEILARPLFTALERLHLASRRERQEESADAAAEDIEALIHVGREAGILEVEEGRLIRQVVEFHDAVVREVMTPRTEIVAIPASASLKDLRDVMAERRHSRIPVCGEQIDNIEGVVHLKDLLAALRADDPAGPITPLVREPFFVPETKQVADLLREFQSRRVQIAVVVDEYGGTAGVVTVEDLLEEIVGEIQEEQDREEPEVAPDGEGGYLVRGNATIDALNDALGTDLPAEGYDTVAGLIYNDLGRIPRAGEAVQREGIRLEVVKADSRRINLIRAGRRGASPGPAGRRR
jgi:CBS domain containing-hemolysin-like protein